MPDLTNPPHVAPQGEHTRHEVLFRITTPDGRISDHGPYAVGNLGAAVAAASMGFRCPPGSTITKLARTVTTVATEWEPVKETR